MWSSGLEMPLTAELTHVTLNLAHCAGCQGARAPFVGGFHEKTVTFQSAPVGEIEFACVKTVLKTTQSNPHKSYDTALG